MGRFLFAGRYRAMAGSADAGILCTARTCQLSPAKLVEGFCVPLVSLLYSTFTDHGYIDKQDTPNPSSKLDGIMQFICKTSFEVQVRFLFLVSFTFFHSLPKH